MNDVTNLDALAVAALALSKSEEKKRKARERQQKFRARLTDEQRSRINAKKLENYYRKRYLQTVTKPRRAAPKALLARKAKSPLVLDSPAAPSCVPMRTPSSDSDDDAESMPSPHLTAVQAPLLLLEMTAT